MTHYSSKMSADNKRDERQAPEEMQKDIKKQKKEFAAAMKNQITSKAPTITSKTE